MLTPDALAAQVTAALDAWDGRIRVDVDIQGCRVQLAEHGPGRVYAEYLAVPVELRRGGYGTAILTAVTGWADRNRITVELGVSPDYGMRRATLERLYRAHGFETVNRCGGMVRQPATVTVNA